MNSLWEAALLAALVWLALRFAPRMNAATRFAIWWAALGVVADSARRSANDRHGAGVVRAGDSPIYTPALCPVSAAGSHYGSGAADHC